MIKENKKEIIIILIIGLFLGPLFDLFLLVGGTTTYTSPQLFNLMPIWTIPMWPFALVLVSHCQQMLFKESPPNDISYLRGSIGFALFTLIYFIAGQEILGNSIRMYAIASLSVVSYYLFDESFESLISSVVVGLSGCIAEIIIIKIGLYKYLSPQILGIPYWLFFLYFCASIHLSNLRVLIYKFCIRGKINNK